MNEKKFLRQLNSSVQNKFITQGYIQDLFNAKKSFFGDQKVEYLIEKHFEKLLKGIPSGYLSLVIQELYTNPQLHNFLSKKETMRTIIQVSEAYEFFDLISSKSMDAKFINYIEENFDEVLNDLSLKKIVFIHNKISLSSQNREKLGKYLQQHKDEFLKEILTTTLSFNDESYQKAQEIVGQLVDKILEKEACKLVDVQELFHGGFSSVIRIGEIVLKVGKPRKTFDIPNDERILQPLLRRELLEEFGIPIVIEVCDRVDTEISLSEEELYSIYEEMRNRGIVCGDFKRSNIGRLRKDNIGRKDDKNGIHGETQRVLKKGEYVILDTDYIYDEDSPNIELTSNESIAYENRYKFEKRQKESLKDNIEEKQVLTARRK